MFTCVEGTMLCRKNRQYDVHVYSPLGFGWYITVVESMLQPATMDNYQTNTGIYIDISP